MTVYLPLDSAAPLPSSPSFLVPSTDPATHLSRAIQAIMKAKRIVVICGAGISVQAGIPDFRSSDGLFQSIKRDNPKEAMSSGKELFDVSVFNSEQKTSLFCQMIAQLSDLSQAAEPTSFHHVLRALDDRGRLLRVYTQNIDAIEQKSGLSFGVPEFEGKRGKSRAKAKAKAVVEETTQIAADADSGADGNATHPDHANANASAPHASTSRLPSPPAETPRCIPLHGTLQSMHCQICNHSFPLHEHLPSLTSGVPPPCPECTSLEATRQLVGKRPRGIGRLRPSVVLYNEAHKDGEGVGDVVQRDLIGASKGKGRSGADLLLVVGTSLRVPGTKRMVREFAKAVRARGGGSGASSVRDEQLATPGNRTRNGNASGSGLATPAPSPRRSPAAEDDSAGSSSANAPMKAVYLNLDFPVPTREWEGVFDAWIQGDAQEFAEVLRREIEKEARAKEVVVERRMRRRREEEEREAAEEAEAKEAAEAMLDLAGEGEKEHELPDYGRMLLEREREREKEEVKAQAQGKEKGKEKEKKHEHGGTSAKRKFGHGPSKNASAAAGSSSSSSTSSLSSLSSLSSASASSSSLTSPSPISSGKRRKPTMPLSPPRTPVVRGERKGERKGGGEVSATTTRRGRGRERSGNNDAEDDNDNNDNDNEDRKKARSKLLVRVPARPVRQHRHGVPEVYIKTKPPPHSHSHLHSHSTSHSPPQPHSHSHLHSQPQPQLQPYYRTVYEVPQYVRPYECLRGSGNGSESARMDVDVNDDDMDMDVDIEGEGEDVEVNYASLSPPVRYASGRRVGRDVSTDAFPPPPPHPYSHSNSRSRSGSGSARELSLSPSLSRHSHPHPHPRSLARSPPPAPPHYLQTPTLATPPRINDHHRLGGKIDHSQTLRSLNNHTSMARTGLQLGARDGA